MSLTRLLPALQVEGQLLCHISWITFCKSTTLETRVKSWEESPFVMAQLVNGVCVLAIVTEQDCDHNTCVPLGETIRKILDFPAFLALRVVM